MNKHSLGQQPWVYPQPVFLVGTYDKDHKPNVMTAAWGGICCSKPPCVTVAIRPARYTHQNVLLRQSFTINIATSEQVIEADFFGIAPGKRIDKFAKTRFTPIQAENVDAPYISECPVILECTLRQHIELGTHTLMIGEILDVKADGSILDKDGKPDLTKFTPLIYAASSSMYYGLGAPVGQAFSVGSPLMRSADKKE